MRLAASPRGVVIHRDDSVSVGRRRGADVDVVAALSQLASHGDDDALIVAVDSARALGLLDAGGLTRLAEVLPRRQRALLALSRDDAGSGIETLARIRLVLLGHSVRTQVELAPDIRVDLLIGDRLVIETDGKQFHDDPEAFARDRDRDLVLKAMGYRVLRLTYQQVIDDWPSVATAVTLICRRGEHFWR